MIDCKILIEGNKEQCKNCSSFLKCQEIIEKYNIKDKSELISISKARNFISDIFDIDFSYPETLLKNARKFDLLTESQGKGMNKVYKISYENIYKLMNIPYYKIYQTGKLHRGKE